MDLNSLLGWLRRGTPGPAVDTRASRHLRGDYPSLEDAARFERENPGALNPGEGYVADFERAFAGRNPQPAQAFLSRQKNPDARAEVLRAMLAGTRHPLIALGIDPDRLAMSNKDYNVRGVYNPEADVVGLARNRGETTASHEFIHRGIDKLRNLGYPSVRGLEDDEDEHDVIAGLLNAMNGAEFKSQSAGGGDGPSIANKQWKRTLSPEAASAWNDKKKKFAALLEALALDAEAEMEHRRREDWSYRGVPSKEPPYDSSIVRGR